MHFPEGNSPDIALPRLYQTVYTHIDPTVQKNIVSLSFTNYMLNSDVSHMSMVSLTAQWIKLLLLLNKRP